MIRLKNILEYGADNHEVQATIDKIEKATHENYHTEAVEILAKFLGDTRSAKILRHIAEIHNLEGGMPQPLEQYRSSIRVELVQKAKQKYGQNVATKINSAF